MVVGSSSVEWSVVGLSGLNSVAIARSTLDKNINGEGERLYSIVI